MFDDDPFTVEYLPGPHEPGKYSVVNGSSSECPVGYFGEGNAVQYNGREYRTLNGTSPHDTNVKCQNYYLSVPGKHGMGLGRRQ